MGAFPQCRCDLGVCDQPGKIVLALGCDDGAGIDHKHDDKAADQAEQEAEPTVEAAEPGLAETRRDQRGKGEPEDDDNDEGNAPGKRLADAFDADQVGQQGLQIRCAQPCRDNRDRPAGQPHDFACHTPERGQSAGHDEYDNRHEIDDVEGGEIKTHKTGPRGRLSASCYTAHDLDQLGKRRGLCD